MSPSCFTPSPDSCWRQNKITHIFGSLSPMWETNIEFLTLDFGLAQTRILQSFSDWTSQINRVFFFCLFVFLGKSKFYDNQQSSREKVMTSLKSSPKSSSPITGPEAWREEVFLEIWDASKTCHCLQQWSVSHFVQVADLSVFHMMLVLLLWKMLELGGHGSFC